MYIRKKKKKKQVKIFLKESDLFYHHILYILNFIFLYFCSAKKAIYFKFILLNNSLFELKMIKIEMLTIKC